MGTPLYGELGQGRKTDLLRLAREFAIMVTHEPKIDTCQVAPQVHV
jgi:hypothetical protein